MRKTMLLLALCSFVCTIECAITKPPTKGSAKGKGSCAKENFEKVSRCCSTAPDEFADFKTLSGCTKMLSGSNLAIMRDYTVNRLQFDNKTIAVGAIGDPVKINTNAFCFAECMFSNLSLITDGAVSYETVTTYVQKRITNANWQTLMSEAVTTCQASIEAIESEDETKKTVTTRGSSFKTCLTAPGLLLQCLLSTVSTNCPEDKKITSPSCLKEGVKFTKCGVFIAAA